MKMIAKAVDGREYLHSVKVGECFFVSDRKAKQVCDIMNDIKYNLQEGRVWHVYDYDYYMLFYVHLELCLKANGELVIKPFTGRTLGRKQAKRGYNYID